MYVQVKYGLNAGYIHLSITRYSFKADQNIVTFLEFRNKNRWNTTEMNRRAGRGEEKNLLSDRPVRGNKQSQVQRESLGRGGGEWPVCESALEVRDRKKRPGLTAPTSKYICGDKMLMHITWFSTGHSAQCGLETHTFYNNIGTCYIFVYIGHKVIFFQTSVNISNITNKQTKV